MTLNEMVSRILQPSIIDLPLLPGVGDEIAFRCPSGFVIDGAMVTETDYFGGQHQFFVRYETTNCVGRWVQMSGWVSQGEVRSTTP